MTKPTDTAIKALERLKGRAYAVDSIWWKEIEAAYETVKAALGELEEHREADNELHRLMKKWKQERTKLKEENQELKAEITRLNALLEEDRLSKILGKFCKECNCLGCDRTPKFDSFVPRFDSFVKEIQGEG